MSRALAFLGIEPTERRSAALMGAHAFFMGCSTVYFETAVSAFFLSRFDSKWLPWVYVAAAAVNMVTGAFYSQIQRRLSFAGLMKGTLWFLLFSVLGMRLGLALTSAAWLVFGGLVWYRVVAILTDLEYWAVANRVYDVRQAKRLFGLIGTGEVIARILGSFSVPFLVKLGGVSNLVFISAGALGMCLLLLTAVLRRADGVSTAPRSAVARAEDRAESEAGLREVISNRYLRIVVGTAVLATFGKYFVDFAFLEQVSTRSKAAADLAGFLGIFTGLAQTLSLLTRIFVSRPLLHRFGIRVGLLVLPVLHLLCSIAVVASGLAGSASMVFWFVIANMGVYDTFKHPIDNPSFKVLYQPLKPAQRLAAQIAVETVFAPVVIGIAGAIMLLFSSRMHYDPMKFSLVLVATFVAWTALALGAGKGYARVLVDMLRRRTEGNDPLDLEDATTLSLLHERLASSSPVEVWFALHLLEKAGFPEIVAVLVERIGHPAPEVRQYVIERLLELKPAELRRLHARLSSDPAPSVRGAAMRGLASSKGDEATRDLVRHLDDDDPTVRRAVVAGLLVLDDRRGHVAARAAVERWAASERSPDRRLAARLAGEHGMRDTLWPLLSDDDPEVRRAAIGAVAHVDDPRMKTTLIETLHDPRFAETAMKSLAAHGDEILPELGRLFGERRPSVVLERVARIHPMVGGRAAIDGLVPHLEFGDALVRGGVVAALDDLAWAADGGDRTAVRTLLRDEVRSIVWARAAQRDLTIEPAAREVCAAIEDDISDARRRVFHLVALAYDRVAIHRALDHLDHASKEKRAYALEVLDLTLGRQDRELVLPLLGDVDRLEKTFRQPRCTAGERLAQLVTRPERWQRGWTRAVAIHTATRLGIGKLADLIGALETTDPVVTDTARWATSLLGDGKMAVRDPREMLLIEKILVLKGVQMFAGTSEELLAEVAALLDRVECKKGELVFEKGDAGDSLYIVITGRVRVFDGDTTIRELGEREIFGELALLDPEPRSASVAALEDSTLFRLDGDMFSQLMAGNLEMVRGVLHVLCERLRVTSAAAAGH